MKESKGMSENDVIVWSKPSCVQCTAVKRALKAAGVPYYEPDLSSEEHASDLVYLKGLGYLSAPITEYGVAGIVFPGNNPFEIDRVIAAWRERNPQLMEA